MKNFKDRDFLLASEDLSVIDVRYSMSDKDYGQMAYDKAHYKGAAFLNLDHDLAGPVKAHGGRHPLPDQENFQEKLRSIGIRNDSKVLIYDDGDNSAAGRLWWMLKYYGLKEVYVLNGGFGKLKDEDLSSEKETFEEGDIILKPDESMTASYEEILEYSKSDHLKNRILIDSRSEERYKGQVEPIDRKKGHIRNAENINFKSHFDENGEIDENSIKENFKNTLAYNDVIFHCGSGVTACTNIMALDELGKSSRLYVGSFSDFVSYEENTVERE